ncbi:unnamed protein product [Trichogramma brassicae]|uniref:Single domain-containing protein n=1 Tax=Trichogramma brassicae TaxID=86971 RepID=A0A6H5HYY1_9HYME|nr:unnamed protein product [Trichogramma brassicae]
MFFFLEYQYYSNETETRNRLGTLWGSVEYRLPNFCRDTVQQKELLSQILLQSARLHRVAQLLKPEGHATQTKRLISACRDTPRKMKARVPAFSQEKMKLRFKGATGYGRCKPEETSDHCPTFKCSDKILGTRQDASKPYPHCCPVPDCS